MIPPLSGWFSNTDVSSSEEGVLSCHQLVVPEPLNVGQPGTQFEKWRFGCGLSKSEEGEISLTCPYVQQPADLFNLY
jgi:hypothetical protein